MLDDGEGKAMLDSSEPSGMIVDYSASANNPENGQTTQDFNMGLDEPTPVMNQGGKNPIANDF